MPTPEPYILFLLGLGCVVLLVSWAPKGLKALPLSLAMICVGIGYAVFSLGWLGFNPDPRSYDTLTQRLTEAVIIIALMGAGLKLDRPVSLKGWAPTWRLLAIAMPLTIAAAAVLGLWGLGFSLSMALLFGASMATTDPVLASDVQTGPPGSGEDNEVRFGLTSEAGLNDALGFPFVHLAILAAGGLTLSGVGEWAAMALGWRVVVGVVIGWIVGRGMAWLIFRGPKQGLARHGDGLVAVGATFVAYALCEVAQGYGFLAVFVCALTIRHAERDHDFHEELHDVAEHVERLLMMLLLVLFGGALANGLLDALTWSDAAVGLAILFVVRPVAGYLSLVGSPLPQRDKLLLAWLGIRGLGSVYYIAYGLNHADFGDSERLWALAGFIILVSIVVHGLTATPLLRLIERLGSRGRTRSVETVKSTGGS